MANDRLSRIGLMRVHGPLDTPALHHNREVELNSVRVLVNSLSGPSARVDAEEMLTMLGWPELAIKLAKGEQI